MYRLYGWKLTGSLAIEAALSEAGAEFEIIPVNLKAGETQTEEFARLNPRRQLPVLTLPDGSSMSEGAAILLHIADAFPEARLAPSPGSPARAQHDRWLLFMAVNVYEGELRKLNPDRYTDDPASVDAVKSAAFNYVDRHYRLLNDAIVGPYFLGETLSVLDIYVWMLAQWMAPDWLASECPEVKKLIEVVATRPKVAPVQTYHIG
jgi:glutathione S-transferase